MEKFKGSGYLTHGHFRAELLIISFVFFIVACVVFPKAKSAYSQIRINSVIDGANSYKDSIDKYYVSHLLSDSNFKLDGSYTISDGKLIDGDNVYNVLMSETGPHDGYLDYENNFLKDGCISIDNYAVILSEGNVVSVLKGSCDKNIDVAYGI